MPTSAVSRHILPLCLGISLIAFLTMGSGIALACTPFIEEHPSWSSASFRPHTTAFEHCEVDEETYLRIVSQWLRNRPADAAAVSSLSLGRVIAYPWLSRHIADSALGKADWAARISRAKPVDRGKLAAEVLRDPTLLQRLAIPFEDTPYLASSVSFEKVLFGKADAYSSNSNAGAVIVPFDAQLWLRITPRN
ncbi:MAG: hypothetical protein IPN64_08640 [Propionivibrio sp.]|uniref:hypothetical protein n=1 Tax=Propionivibrio sp. TaxID=2212460 RepID=UPI0025D2CE87|nr:hypothetical protein [Propionivibrio sp.]MBK8894116.1 hypothetical protein [Propionivibrio sp.]